MYIYIYIWVSQTYIPKRFLLSTQLASRRTLPAAARCPASRPPVPAGRPPARNVVVEGEESVNKALPETWPSGIPEYQN